MIRYGLLVQWGPQAKSMQLMLRQGPVTALCTPNILCHCSSLPQEAALAATRKRMEVAVPEQERPVVHYLHRCHSQMQQHVGSHQADLVCFNLGYLPGSKDKLQTATRKPTTLAAVEGALEVLRQGGLLSILAYLQHEGGTEEYLGVAELLRALPRERWTCSETELLNSPTAPRLLLVWAHED